jgi:hypothetical protein
LKTGSQSGSELRSYLRKAPIMIQLCVFAGI